MGTKDKKSLKELESEALASNNPELEKALGLVYELGLEGEPDLEAATKWFGKAAGTPS